MKKVLAVILWLMPAIGVIALSTGAQVKQPLKLVATTPLPGFSGDFDHFALDLKGQRLFLTAEDHKTVEVFDLEGKHLHSITGFGQPHAALGFRCGIDGYRRRDGLWLLGRAGTDRAFDPRHAITDRRDWHRGGCRGRHSRRGPHSGAGRPIVLSLFRQPFPEGKF